MSLFRFTQWISEEHPVLVFGDGLQSRDFTYVEYIARGTIAGLKPLGYQIINLGSDTPIVLMDAIRLIERLVGKKAILHFQPRHVADVPASWADINKAERLLAWRPQYVSIRERCRSAREVVPKQSRMGQGYSYLVAEDVWSIILI